MRNSFDQSACTLSFLPRKKKKKNQGVTYQFKCTLEILLIVLPNRNAFVNCSRRPELFPHAFQDEHIN